MIAAAVTRRSFEYGVHGPETDLASETCQSACRDRVRPRLGAERAGSRPAARLVARLPTGTRSRQAAHVWFPGRAPECPGSHRRPNHTWRGQPRLTPLVSGVSD